MNVQAIVLARGGSKGIPQKNIVDFCGKPLMAWTLEQCSSSEQVSDVWVSSDCDDILSLAEQYGAKTIRRPDDISGDFATSESAWLHALDHIEQHQGKVDIVLAPQVTSPLRERADIDQALAKFVDEQYDSMFSCSIVEDLFFWEKLPGEGLHSINYDYKNRQRRQDITKKFIENGSFYLFKPEILRQYNNRFGGRIGCSEMAFWKMFEIDGSDDIRMCKALMREFLL